MNKKLFCIFLTLILIFAFSHSVFASAIAVIGGSDFTSVSEETDLTIYISYSGRVTSIEVEVDNTECFAITDCQWLLDGSVNSIGLDEEGKTSIKDLSLDSLNCNVFEISVKGLSIDGNGKISMAYYLFNGDDKVSSGYVVKDIAVRCRNHHFTEWETQSVAACEQSGLMIRKCSVCGLEEHWTIPAFGHELEELTITREATCTIPGEAEGDCSRCKEHVVIQTSLVGHTYGEWYIDENGKTVRECWICGSIDEQQLVEPLKEDEPIEDDDSIIEPVDNPNTISDDGCDILDSIKNLSKKKQLLLLAFGICDLFVIVGGIIYFSRKKKK